VQIDQLWTKTDVIFRREVSEDVADIWLSQLNATAFEDKVLYLTGPERARSWVDLRYRRVLAQCAGEAYGIPVEVRLVTADEAPASQTQTAAAEDHESKWHASPLNPRYTFDQFVIGESNHVGHAAALAVAEQPAQAFNPLFIYGAPGVGKTHLLHAVGNFMAAHTPEANVRYLTAENFATIFRSVVRTNTIQDFKEDLRRTDVLLIDDIQFLQNKVKTVEEFFHTFNQLHEAGRQLVITSDRTPRELSDFADRLRERFESGLVVEIDRPSAKLRRAILSKRVKVENIPIDDDMALDRIAERAPDNIRSLEGALIRVSAFASLRGRPVTRELVDELLDTLHPHTSSAESLVDRKPVAIDVVIATVADHFDLSIEQLLSADRSRNVAGPRQIAMYLACELSGQSLKSVAKAFGRDHSTVSHAREKVSTDRRRGGSTAGVVDSLRETIHTRGTTVDATTQPTDSQNQSQSEEDGLSTASNAQQQQS
jgi:chromosomal replication initiator protein